MTTRRPALPRLPLGLLLGLLLGPSTGCGSADPAPVDPAPVAPAPAAPASLAPRLDAPQAPAGGPLALSDLSGLYPRVERPAAAPALLCAVLRLGEDGACRVVRTEEVAAWGGLLLPGWSATPPPGAGQLRESRLKVRSSGRVELVLDGEVCGDWEQLRAALGRALAEPGARGELILDGRGQVPARFVLAALGLALGQGATVVLAAPELEASELTGLRAELERLAAGAPREADGLPRLAVRIEADARTSWRRVAAVLEVVAASRIQRFTLPVVVEGAVVDLQALGRDAAGGWVAAEQRPPLPRVEKPIIVLDEELEAPLLDEAERD